MPLGNNILIFSEVYSYAFLDGTFRTAFSLKLIFPQYWILCLIPDVLQGFSTLAGGNTSCSLPSVTLAIVLPAPFQWSFPLPWVLFTHRCADMDSGEDEREAFCRFPDSLTVGLSFLPSSALQIPADLASSYYQLCLLNSGVLLGSTWVTPNHPTMAWKLSSDSKLGQL